MVGWLNDYRAASHILTGLGFVVSNTRVVMYVARVCFRNNLDAGFQAAFLAWLTASTKKYIYIKSYEF